MSRLTVTLLLLITLPLFSAHGAPPKPRPLAGSGILLIRPAPSTETGTTATLVVYREPSVGRIVELAYDKLPLLSRAIALPAGEYAVAVLGRKGDWAKIAYDEAGREGWVELARRWRYIPWSEFLPGRSARLMQGLKKDFYTVRQKPDETSAEVATLPPLKEFRILGAEGVWIRVGAGGALSGWLRWRDGNGRFLISDTRSAAEQKD